jgi:hypothetical protein
MYWMSTKSPNAMFRPSYQNAENDALIRETVGIDPAILVADLHLSAGHIRTYQRKLGLRKFTGNEPARGIRCKSPS